ncbi:hypothetical protein WR25_12882 [Diploscapter pachys]|uniref:Uncharacterized protein n=1 Tax=Diploscapter pachys TaxID=2018661 RepID=A0A2A2M5Z7_9BILA|nr:hypothetical protein WR25_12882 [Diploscapter pachys]
MTRSGCLSPAARLVIDSEEVLLARMQSVAHRPSSRRSRSCLTGSCSTMASITRWASARASRVSTGCSRSRITLRLSGASLPFSTCRPSRRSMPSIACSAAPGRVS